MTELADLSVSDLLAQGTCAVIIDENIRGAACLVSSEGHLLTAGHILGKKNPLTRVEVRFLDDGPRKAHKIQWGYQQEMGIDFAVLKLDNLPDHRYPLPVSLDHEVTDSFRTCGYGVTLVDQSWGTGHFVGSLHLQGSTGFRLFKLRSPELGEEGYSGAAIFSDKIRAVVGIQIEATRSATGSERDTILAMPLYRIAHHWPRLDQIARERIAKILSIASKKIGERLLPDSDSAIQELYQGLNGFATYHKHLYEWKGLHNLSQDLYTAVSQFSIGVNQLIDPPTKKW